jgi:hypothetical protein
MSDVGSIGKNDTNEYDKYKFRGIDAVMNALYPAMVKNHVFVTPTVLDTHREERAGKNGSNMMYSILTVKYTFYTDDGSSVECVVVGEAMDRSDKSTNKAMSAAFKYACFQTFCIPTDEMKDADAESPEIGERVISEADLKKWLAAIDAECERTGLTRETVFSTVSIKSEAELNLAVFKKIMNKFEKTPDKGKK